MHSAQWHKFTTETEVEQFKLGKVGFLQPQYNTGVGRLWLVTTFLLVDCEQKSARKNAKKLSEHDTRGASSEAERRDALLAALPLARDSRAPPSPLEYRVRSVFCVLPHGFLIRRETARSLTSCVILSEKLKPQGRRKTVVSKQKWRPCISCVLEHHTTRFCTNAVRTLLNEFNSPPNFPLVSFVSRIEMSIVFPFWPALLLALCGRCPWQCCSVASFCT